MTKADDPSTTNEKRSRPRGRPRNDAVDRPTVDGILDAVERVFAAQGFGRTSLRMLIEASQMSTTRFYPRFASKDAVLAALVERVVGAIAVAFMQPSAQAEDIATGFDVGVDALVDALGQHRAVVRAALGEGAGSASVRATLLAGDQQLAARLSSSLQVVVDRGRVAAFDVGALVWAIVGALQLHVVRWAVFDDRDDDGLRRALRATAKTLLPTRVADS